MLPHGPIEKLEDNLWRIEGTLPNMPLKRASPSSAGGELVVHNPIALDAADMIALDKFGPVAFIAIPNGWHRTDLKSSAARYPAAKVIVPPGARAKVAEVHPVTGELASIAGVVTLAGTRDRELVMRVASGERATLVFRAGAPPGRRRSASYP